MFIFPLIYVISFFIAAREVLKGNREGILIFLIFGLSIYTTAMSVTFMLGLKVLIPFFQFFKEILVLSVFILNLVNLKYRPRLNIIDYAILAFFLYLVLYAVLPIGEQSFANRLMALKSNSFFIIVYFTGRLLDPKSIYINKYFNYIILLTIAAGAVLVVELLMYRQLQLFTGYVEYCYYYFNFEPDGLFGLSTTFDSDSGYRRFASFFTNPLEHAVSTLFALSVIMALYTSDDNKFRITNTGMLALAASFLSILFALSRAPLASYFVILYAYALITKKRYITNSIHAAFVLGAIYLAYLFLQFENNHSGIIAVIMNTVNFTDPSSIGHIEQWAEGIVAMMAHPLGLGLGSSGRVAGSLGENVGGENQFIIIGVQAGIIALLLYLFVYIMFIKTGLKWLPRLKGKERKVCMAVVLLKIGLFISLLTSEVESSSYLSYLNWLLSGILITIIMQQKPTQIQPAYDS
ncbi:MAG: O-antigen ligase family protein [Mucilaginibacter sp.]